MPDATPTPQAYTETATPLPAPDPYAGLPRHKRELLMALDRVDFWRSGKARQAVVSWNGVRQTVGTVEQCGYG